MLYLKADTITEVTVGPAVAVGDGFTPVTNLVGSSADEFEIIKHGATSTTTIAGTLAAITGADGYYALDISATDTNTEGRLVLLINDDSLILPIRHEFMVVNANVFDSLFAAASTDVLDVNAVQLVGGAQSATDLKDFADDGYDPATNKVQGVVLVDTLTTYTGNTPQTADHTAGIADIPTVAEFNARTLVAASYFDPAADTVATVTTVTNQLSAAAINAEVDTALTDIHLDHLMATAAADVIVDGSVIAHMVSSTEDWSTFVPSTDSLQAVRDRGDAAWVTGAGGADKLVLQDTTIATLATQISFTLTAGSADNDAYNNCTIVIEDVSTSTQKAVGMVLDYIGSSKTITLKEALAFTIATTDKVYILAENSLKSTAANRQLDVTATGAAGIDWANVENPTTALDLSATGIQLVDTTTTNTDMVAAAPTAAQNRTEMDSNSTQLAAIVADTNELQGDDVPGLIAALDIVVDRVEADTQDIQSRLPSALVSGRMSSDVVAISGDATAADNLEATYDGTGYTNENAPSTQAQVGAIGSSGGGALNFQAISDNVLADIKGIAFVGVQTTGTFANTEAEDGVYHVIDDTGDAIDIVYRVNVGGSRAATEVIFKGFLNSGNDELNIQAYDFIGADWETRKVLPGQNGSSNIESVIPYLSKHTGTGSDLGDVLIRFVGAGGSNPSFSVDELLVEAISLMTTVGYVKEAAISIDTTLGTAGTEDGVNGTEIGRAHV